MKIGQIVHLSIPTTNIILSIHFYESIFGITFIKMNDDYYLAEGKDNPIALEQVHKIANNGKTSVPFLLVDNLDLIIRKIIQFQGIIVQGKTKISDNYGYFAIIQDPYGVQIGIWNLHP